MQVGERDALAHGQALDLVEHRRVGGVGVAPVDAAGDDDEDRRPPGPPCRGPASARCGCGAARRAGPGGTCSGSPSEPTSARAGPSEAGIDVEGVLEHPRRVPGRVVERGEVVVVVLDLGPLDDLVAEADEDVLDLAPGAGQRMQVAEPHGRRPGQRHVDRLGGQPARRARPARAAPCAAASSASSSPAGLVARLADRAPLLRRADRRCRAGSSSAPPCGPGSGPAAPRARPRPARPRSPPGLARVSLRSAPASSSARPPRADRRYPLQRRSPPPRRR